MVMPINRVLAMVVFLIAGTLLLAARRFNIARVVRRGFLTLPAIVVVGGAVMAWWWQVGSSDKADFLMAFVMLDAAIAISFALGAALGIDEIVRRLRRSHRSTLEMSR